MRAAGLAAHTSAACGMPLDDRSLTIGPIYIAVYLLSVTVAPILVLASLLELAALRYGGPLRWAWWRARVTRRESAAVDS
jgi:hypothetical protein